MRKYLSELHKKSPEHKKRFSFAVSGAATLVIFAIWSAVTLGGEPQIARDTTGPVNLAAASEATAFEDILDGIKGAWENLKGISDGR